MAKKKREWEFKPFEGSTKNGRHLRITKEMMESKAWRALNSAAIQVYLEMKIRYNGCNEDDISLTYKDASEFMARGTFAKSIDTLIETGFISIVRQAWTSRECNIYGFSDRWKKYGTDEFIVEKRTKRVIRE